MELGLLSLVPVFVLPEGSIECKEDPLVHLGIRWMGGERPEQGGKILLLPPFGEGRLEASPTPDGTPELRPVDKGFRCLLVGCDGMEKCLNPT